LYFALDEEFFACCWGDECGHTYKLTSYPWSKRGLERSLNPEYGTQRPSRSNFLRSFLVRATYTKLICVRDWVKERP
jgi:hypothetical protein